MTIMIVETTFQEPYTDELHAKDGKVLDKCLAAHGATWMRSYLSSDRLRMICHFEAPDAEAVRASYRTASVRFDRVWTAELYAR
jgi:uncharacterized protein DUF4242